MTRKDLIKHVAQTNGITLDAAEKLLDTTFDFIGDALAKGEEVKLMNFGKFEPRQRRAVQRRNPRTGEAVEVPEKVSVGFKPSPALKERVNI